MIISRFYFICVLPVLIHKVYLQVSVEAVIGGSVVLPCFSTDHAHKLQDTGVHWRHNGSKIVYDIVQGEDSVAEQDQRYKNRAETFPDEYDRGNFSLKLTNLQYGDGGKYICFITPSSEQKTVQLIINESTTEIGKGSTDQENQREETGAAVETSSHFLWVFIVLPVVFLC